MADREGIDYVALPFLLLALGLLLVFVLPFWAIGRGIALLWPSVFKHVGWGLD